MKVSGKKLTLWVVYYSIFISFLIYNLGLPFFLKYILDILCIVLIPFIFKSRYKNKYFKELACLVLIFLIYTLFAYIYNYESLFLYLWCVRTYFRFYIIMLACMEFLAIEDYLAFFRKCDIIHYFNFCMIIIQFLIYHYQGDYLGGIFGNYLGCNGFLLVFISFVSVKSLVMYINKQETLKRLLINILLSLIISIMSELKLFFILLVICLLLCFVLNKKTGRVLFVASGVTAGIIIGIMLLGILYPNFDNFFTFDSLYNYSTTSYGNTLEAVSRFGSIEYINNHFLLSNLQRMIGLGFGNCSYVAGLSTLTSEFYYSHSSLNYDRFSLPFLYLESGMIGVVLYLLVFVYLGINSWILNKKLTYGSTKGVCQISFIIVVVCLIMIVYNNSIKTEAGFLVFFLMAAPFCIKGNS